MELARTMGRPGINRLAMGFKSGISRLGGEVLRNVPERFLQKIDLGHGIRAYGIRLQSFGLDIVKPLSFFAGGKLQSSEEIVLKIIGEQLEALSREMNVPDGVREIFKAPLHPELDDGIGYNLVDVFQRVPGREFERRVKNGLRDMIDAWWKGGETAAINTFIEDRRWHLG